MVTKVVPSQVLENALHAAGFSVKCNWQVRGAVNDGWAWLEHITISMGQSHAAVIVQTFKDGNGWDAYVASTTVETSQTIYGVIRATGLDPLELLRIPRFVDHMTALKSS